MVFVPAGEFTMGNDSEDGRPDERPAHRVRVSGFWLDETPVTNAQFRAFVEATGYVTTAEKPPVLDGSIAPGSLVFAPPAEPVPLNDVRRWWSWVPGAHWRHPEGPGSDIAGRDDHPVVQVSWDDARAFAEWAGKRLPTEAEWERAARGGLEGKRYAWGDEDPSLDLPRCNIWQGRFPDVSTKRRGRERTSPVRTFPPNGFGLHDMAGNVWQWCADYYRPDTYRRRAGSAPVVDPAGPVDSFDPEEPGAVKRVQRGGSFLCSACYCTGYRVSARMKTTPDTSLEHSGFRCAASRQP
jgi:formylglycine-generating enzyme required for sulfatase activity